MSCERTFFSGVKLDRLCEERSNPDSEKKFLEDPAALCLLFGNSSNTIALLGDDKVKKLYMSNLHSEALGLIDRSTLTFLGVQPNDTKTPVFAAHINDDDRDRKTVAAIREKGASFERAIRIAGLLTADEGALLGYAKSMVRQHSVATFCPVCGSKTVPQWIGTNRFCALCKRDIFTRTDPVSIVVVVHPTDPSKALLVHKLGFPTLFHSCVAGFIEPGETAEEACCREVMEETGVALDLGSLRFVATQPWPADIGSQLMIGFIGRALIEGTTLDPNEIDHAQWYTKDEVRRSLDGDKDVTENVLSLPVVTGLASKMLRIWVESSF